MTTFEDTKDPALCLHEGLRRSVFTQFLTDCIKKLDPEEFTDVWDKLPRAHRAVAFSLPPGVTNDVKSLPEPERPAMHSKLIDIRRERCLPCLCCVLFATVRSGCGAHAYASAARGRVRQCVAS